MMPIFISIFSSLLFSEKVSWWWQLKWVNLWYQFFTQLGLSNTYLYMITMIHIVLIFYNFHHQIPVFPMYRLKPYFLFYFKNSIILVESYLKIVKFTRVTYSQCQNGTSHRDIYRDLLYKNYVLRNWELKQSES